MIIGYPPFYSESANETCSKILNWPETFFFPEDKVISHDAKDLISKLLTTPNERLGYNGADEIKAHSFFHGINFDRMRSMRPYFVPNLQYDYDTQYFEDLDQINPMPSGIRDKNLVLSQFSYTDSQIFSVVPKRFNADSYNTDPVKSSFTTEEDASRVVITENPTISVDTIDTKDSLQIKNKIISTSDINTPAHLTITTPNKRNFDSNTYTIKHINSTNNKDRKEVKKQMNDINFKINAYKSVTNLNKKRDIEGTSNSKIKEASIFQVNNLPRNIASLIQVRQTKKNLKPKTRANLPINLNFNKSVSIKKDTIDSSKQFTVNYKPPAKVDKHYTKIMDTISSISKSKQKASNSTQQPQTVKNLKKPIINYLSEPNKTMNISIKGMKPNLTQIHQQSLTCLIQPAGLFNKYRVDRGNLPNNKSNTESFNLTKDFMGNQIFNSKLLTISKREIKPLKNQVISQSTSLKENQINLLINKIKPSLKLDDCLFSGNKANSNNISKPLSTTNYQRNKILFKQSTVQNTIKIKSNSKLPTPKTKSSKEDNMFIFNKPKDVRTQTDNPCSPQIDIIQTNHYNINLSLNVISCPKKSEPPKKVELKARSKVKFANAL